MASFMVTTIVKHYLRRSQALPVPLEQAHDQAMLTPAEKKKVDAERRRRKTARIQYLKALGERVRARAAEKQIKPSVIASECGVTRQAVNSWFATGRIHKDHLAKLARLLGWTVFELLGDTPVSMPTDTAISASAQYLAELFDAMPQERQQSLWPALLQLLEHHTNGDAPPRPGKQPPPKRPSSHRH